MFKKALTGGVFRSQVSKFSTQRLIAGKMELVRRGLYLDLYYVQITVDYSVLSRRRTT